MPKPKIRLAKFLAASGVASRRQAEELILAGRVKIAGRIVKDVVTNVAEDADNIRVNNQPVMTDKKIYYLLNKPRGYVCSVRDPHNEQTVLSLVPAQPRVVPAGRLDKDSQGLLLLTNDGDLIYKITHPKFEMRKTYIVQVDRDLDQNIRDTLLFGIKLNEGLAQADKVRIINPRQLEIVIHQGWKRQVRRMLDKLGYQVLSLTRIAEGRLKLNDLAEGKYRILNKSEIV